MPDPLLDVRELETKFFLRKGTLTAVDRVSFQLNRKETLGAQVVGIGLSRRGSNKKSLPIIPRA